MKKLLPLFFAFVLAFLLVMPGFAKEDTKKGPASTTETGKAHKKHAEKKGAKKGKKKGQQGTAPGQESKKK